MSGRETMIRQQKNTSFGAHEYRDGVSYSEHAKEKDIIEHDDLVNLSVGECFVFLPKPEVRLAKVEIPQAKKDDRNHGFIQAEQKEKKKRNLHYNKNDKQLKNPKKVLERSKRQNSHKKKQKNKDYVKT